MRNRIKNITLTYGVNLLFVALLLAFAGGLSALGLDGAFSVVFFFAVIVSLLPVVNYLHTIIDSYISPIRYNDLYVQTVDSILNIESFDEVLRTTFDQILDLISVGTGMLIFYYHDRDEFNIFYQKNRRRKIIRNARISKDNMLFRVINGPEDVIVRSKLNPSIHFENSIIAELDRLGGEVVVPIYYHEMFLGLIVTGGQRRRFSPGEIRLLRIFASKIAILSVNRFFFNEIVKKKELEKEYELAARVQKKFLPPTGAVIGRFELRVYHETASLMIREFYDVFENDAGEDDIRISAYRIKSGIAGTSILMPGVQSVLQSFARLGLSPSGVLARMKRIIRAKHLHAQDLFIMHGSLKQNGEFFFSSYGYPAPLVYRRGGGLHPHRREGRGATQSLRMQPGDIMILCCDSFYRALVENLPAFADVIERNHGAPLSRLRSAMIRSLAESTGQGSSDRLLIMVRMEERS
ncbi:MAG: SpoIIE family protein phosphatase [Spirochaetes bacterium]|jgi:hypothetical protein|nr:SpoIIE family protein phosphatase [Spirochaetota bacterium]